MTGVQRLQRTANREQGIGSAAGSATPQLRIQRHAVRALAVGL